MPTAWRKALNSDYAYWSLLLLVLGLLFPTTTVKFAPDSIRYLEEAYQMYAAQTYDRLFRGPMMAFYGAIAIALSGGEPLSVIVLPRLGLVLSALAFATLALRLYGKVASLFATLIFVFLPVIHDISTAYHIDIFVIFTALFALAALFHALDRLSVKWAAASGMLLGVAFLTKEVAILLLPVWVAAWLCFPKYNRALVRCTFVSFGSFTLTVLPWVIHVISSSGVNRVIGKNVGQGGGKFSGLLAELTSAPLSWAGQAPLRIRDFYEKYVFTHDHLGDTVSTLSNTTSATIVIAFQVAFLIKLIVYKRRQDLFVAMTYASVFPLIIYLGTYDFNTRQSAIIQTLGLLPMASVLSLFFCRSVYGDLIQKLRPEGSSAGFGNSGVSLVAIRGLLAGSILFAIFATSQEHERFSDKPASFTILSNSEIYFQPIGSLDKSVISAAKWLRDHTDGKARALTAYRRNSRMVGLYFDHGAFGVPVEIGNVKFWRVENSTRIETPSESLQSRRDVSVPDVSRPFFIYLNRPDHSRWLPCIREANLDTVPDHFCKFYVVDEVDLFEEIRTQKIDYVIVGSKYNIMKRFFASSPSFQLEKVITEPARYDAEGRLEETSIFSVVGQKHHDLEFPIVSSRLPEFLQAYRTIDEEEFSAFNQSVLIERLGLGAATAAAIFRGEVPCFKRQDWFGDQTECETLASPSPPERYQPK